MTNDSSTVQETLESAFAELGSTSEPIVTIKAYILANEQKNDAEGKLKILKPLVDEIRCLEIIPQGMRVIEYHEGGDLITGRKKVAIEGAFRGKKGEYVLTNVRNGGQTDIPLENAQRLLDDKIISQTVFDLLVRKGDPYHYNLVRHTAGKAK